jgi:hypothetical protein
MKTRTMSSRVAAADLTTLDGGLVERAEPEPTGAEACVVCGGASADLICQACRALISEAAFVTR